MNSRRGFLAGLLAASAVGATSKSKKAEAAPMVETFIPYGVPSSYYNPWWGQTDVRKPAIYFTAHQDDEALTLGPDIEKHVAANRFVIVVLCTDGRSTGAEAAVEARLGRDIGVQELVQARNYEFMASCAALGAHQIAFQPGFDGGLTQVHADLIVRQFVDRWPEASFKAQSDTDTSRDHARLGIALRKVKQERGAALDARFFLKRRDWDQISTRAAWRVQGGEPTRNALRNYQLWDPANHRYAVGAASVPNEIQNAIDDPATYCHQ